MIDNNSSSWSDRDYHGEKLKNNSEEMPWIIWKYIKDTQESKIRLQQ